MVFVVIIRVRFIYRLNRCLGVLGEVFKFLVINKIGRVVVLKMFRCFIFGYVCVRLSMSL